MGETSQGSVAGKGPFWSRRRFWLGGGVVAGLAALVAVAPRAWAFHGLAGEAMGGGRGRHAFVARMLKDPAAAKEHANMAVEWALRGVDATDEQKQRAKGIADRLIDQIGPMAEKHREHREAIVRELARPQIDREALERLRREEIALADEASKLAVDSIADLGEVLTPEQRTELITFAHRFHAEGALH
jgi:periplasmic protein CpxP/Spy